MLKLGFEEYLRLRRTLRLDNLDRFRYPRCVLVSILIQKNVEFVKRRYSLYIKRLDEIAEYWKRKRDFPRWLIAPPTIKARLLMKSLGFTKSEIRKALSDPDVVDDEDLRNYIWRANLTDYIYSPIATRFHQIKGRLGEEIIRSWLEQLEVPFVDEHELRKNGGKTPDFYLEEPIELRGKEVVWIESKAMFGDLDVHSQYWKRQFSEYLREFGRGVVIYWFGHIDGLALASNGYEVPAELRRRLTDMRIFLGEGVSFSDVEVFSHEFMKRLEEVLQRYYKGERVVIEPNRWAVRILSRLGFEIVRR
jgi:hypothetical protein